MECCFLSSSLLSLARIMAACCAMPWSAGIHRTAAPPPASFLTPACASPPYPSKRSASFWQDVRLAPYTPSSATATSATDPTFNASVAAASTVDHDGTSVYARSTSPVGSVPGTDSWVSHSMRRAMRQTGRLITQRKGQSLHSDSLRRSLLARSGSTVQQGSYTEESEGRSGLTDGTDQTEWQLVPEEMRSNVEGLTAEFSKSYPTMDGGFCQHHSPPTCTQCSHCSEPNFGPTHT